MFILILCAFWGIRGHLFFVFHCLLLFFRINVDLAIFQPYLDLEAGDNQSLKIQVARPGIEPRSFCSASQKFNHSSTAAPSLFSVCMSPCLWHKNICLDDYFYM